MDRIRLSTALGLSVLLSAAPALGQGEGRPPPVEEAAPHVRNQLAADRIFLRLAQSPSLRDANIRVTVQGDTATLEGTVPSQSAEQRALGLAAKDPQIRDVQDRLEVQPAPQARQAAGPAGQVDDSRIAERVARQLAQTVPGGQVGEELFGGWRVRGAGDIEIDVSVDDGDVTLEGNVPSMKHVREAVQTARQLPGVRSVRSELAFEQGVPRDQLRSYVGALQRMSDAEPRIGQALRQGQPVSADVLDRVPWGEARQAIEQAGLDQDEFRRITERLLQDQRLQRQFAQVARQQVQQSGGAQPGASPQ